MHYENPILDRKVGRNAQLFAQAVAELDTAEDRFPYLRILVSLVEQAHPEWHQTSDKERQISDLLVQMSKDQLHADEVREVVRVREEEKRLKK